MEDAMKFETNAIRIIAIMICLFPGPANASEKRDNAKLLCEGNNMVCKLACGKPVSGVDIDEGYEQCLDDCVSEYAACLVDAGKIPRKSPGKLNDLPALTPNNIPDNSVGGDGQIQ
jgi:hypothetical protein